VASEQSDSGIDLGRGKELMRLGYKQILIEAQLKNEKRVKKQR